MVVKENDQYRIAGEEMLKSTTAGAPDAAASAPDPRDFSFVATPEGDAILLGELKDLNAVTGHPFLAAPLIAERPVLASARRVVSVAPTAGAAAARRVNGPSRG